MIKWSGRRGPGPGGRPRDPRRWRPAALVWVSGGGLGDNICVSLNFARFRPIALIFNIDGMKNPGFERFGAV